MKAYKPFPGDIVSVVSGSHKGSSGEVTMVDIGRRQVNIAAESGEHLTAVEFTAVRIERYR